MRLLKSTSGKTIAHKDHIKALLIQLEKALIM